MLGGRERGSFVRTRGGRWKEGEEGREMEEKERKGGGWRERRRGRKGDGCVGVSQGGERTGMDEGNEGGGWGDERGGWDGMDA